MCNVIPKHGYFDYGRILAGEYNKLPVVAARTAPKRVQPPPKVEEVIEQPLEPEFVEVVPVRTTTTTRAPVRTTTTARAPVVVDTEEPDYGSGLVDYFDTDSDTVDRVFNTDEPEDSEEVEYEYVYEYEYV